MQIAALDSAALHHRLGELACAERALQVDFLLHLDELDRRRAWLDAGYDSLWSYCLRALHLREGAAGRRIGAMRVLRRHPRLAGPLRDGRLCLSTAALLAPVLRDGNLDDLVARAAFRTKAEVEHLVASLAPRRAPAQGLRRIAAAPASTATASRMTLPAAGGSGDAASTPPPSVVDAASTPGPSVGDAASTLERAEVAASPAPAIPAPPPAVVPAAPHDSLEPPAQSLPPPPRPSRSTVEPIAADTYSLRVTVDAAFKEDLARLTDLLGHKVPSGELSAVLHEAIRCAIEKHGKRRGAVEPARTRAPRPAARARAAAQPLAAPPGQTALRAAANEPADDAARALTPPSSPSASPSVAPREPSARAIPAALRRQVWKRDGGRCTWRAPDGRRCESRRRLEIDHVHPVALGGTATIDNLRLLCAGHNSLHAEQVFGREHMARFRRPATATATAAPAAHPASLSGEFAIAGDSSA